MRWRWVRRGTGKVKYGYRYRVVLRTTLGGMETSYWTNWKLFALIVWFWYEGTRCLEVEMLDYTLPQRDRP